MPFFEYRAVGADGKVINGTGEFATETDVSTQLSSDGLTPLRIKFVSNDAGKVASSPSLGQFLSLGRGKKANQVANFTRELSIMLSASVPLERSLNLLQKLSEDDAFAAIIRDVLDRVRKGSKLADAFETHSVFSGLYVSMVRAGEAGGLLEVTMERLADYLERTKSLKRTAISASIYPAILLVVSVISLVLLLGFVVPEFEELFSDMGAALPLPTQIVLGVGNWVGSYWWLIILSVVGLTYLISNSLRNPATRAKLDRLILGNRFTGDLVAKLDTARLTRTLGTLLQGGVSIVGALNIAKSTVGNSMLREDLSAGEGALKEGKLLSTVLIERGNFPTLAMHMLQVGEETGNLEGMLLKVADIYDLEVNEAVKRFLSLLEPVMILGLGVMVGAIIISILVGIMGINELVV